MSKKIVFLLCLVFIMVSCKGEKSNIQEEYLSEIEEEYTPTDDFVTNEVPIIEAEAYTNGKKVETNPRTMTITPYSGTKKEDTSSNPKVYKPLQTKQSKSSGSSSYKTYSTPAPKKVTKYTSANFDTKWSKTDDSAEIKDIRVMIANREYLPAKYYIDRFDFNALPANIDKGHLYQFKGIVSFFLVPTDTNAMVIAEESFKMVADNTKIEKFKPLSLLWNGMLYQKYSNDPVKLNEAIALFDRVITEYPQTRFVNDAVFYKAVTLQKLGRPADEYNDLFLSIKKGGYPDALVYSQVVNDYVLGSSLVDSKMMR